MSQLGPGPIEGSYWVQHRFAVGEYPAGWGKRETRSRLGGLLRLGVTFFLDLTERREKGLRPYERLLRREARALRRRVDYTRVPIPDFDIPSVAQMRHILDRLDAALAAGQVVYLHCYAGLGRTGTVVGCFLVRHGLSGPAALDEIVALRRGIDPLGRPSPITVEQRGMVLDWAG